MWQCCVTIAICREGQRMEPSQNPHAKAKAFVLAAMNWIHTERPSMEEVGRLRQALTETELREVRKIWEALNKHLADL